MGASKQEVFSEIKLEYSDKQVSAWGGMYAMKALMEKINLRQMLEDLNLPQPNSNRGYNPIDVLEAFMVSMWCGASRFTHSSYLRYDHTLKEIFGWRCAPSQSTYSRFFNKFSHKRNTEVFPKLQKRFMSQFKVDKLTIDLDSTVITRYGEQEGAHKGYNPKKPGRNSHRPLLAFSAEGKLIVNAWQRRGDVGDSNGFIDFLTETQQILGDKRIGLLRADSGFYSDANFNYLEQHQINYIVSVPKYPWIRQQMGAITDWLPLGKGVHIGEMQYQSPTWKGGKSRRMVVVRQCVKSRPTAQGRLFDDLPGYKYSCLVTNVSFSHHQIWKLYRQRADCENRIKELKEDFGADNFCLQNFWATEAALRTMVLAYNLMALFNLSALQTENRKQLKTLRFECYAIGSWISKHARQKVLNLSVPIKKRPWINRLLLNISGMVIPIALNSIA